MSNLKKIGEVFQAYDYDKKGNLIRYGKTKPPKYDLQRVTAPVYTFRIDIMK